MTPNPTIDDLLTHLALPRSISRIHDQRPAFHAPIVDDRRLAYFLAEEGADPVRLIESLNLSVTGAGFVMDYCERNYFSYRGPLGPLHLHLDNSPEGLSARLDAAGRPVEVARTWHRIPAGRLVVTFAI